MLAKANETASVFDFFRNRFLIPEFSVVSRGIATFTLVFDGHSCSYFPFRTSGWACDPSLFVVHGAWLSLRLAPTFHSSLTSVCRERLDIFDWTLFVFDVTRGTHLV